MAKKMRIVPRFSKAQRIAHWTFVAAFFTLLITGLILYVPWTSTLASWKIYGWSWERLLHRVAAVVLLLVPLYYLLAEPRGLWELVYDSFLSWDEDDLKWLPHFIPYVLGRPGHLPPQGRINAGEKLHHATIIIFYFLIAGSGLVMWLGEPIIHQAQYHDFALAMVLLHDISMFVMAVLTFGHMYFSFVYGALPGMVDGYVTETYAAMEHPKWLAKLREEGKLVEIGEKEFASQCSGWKKALRACWWNL